MLHLARPNPSARTTRVATRHAIRIGVAALALLASMPTRAGFVATTISVAATVVAACRIDAKQVMASVDAAPGHVVACASGPESYLVLLPQPVIAIERSTYPDSPLLIVTF